MPPAYLDYPAKFPIDSHAREYQDWTTGCGDQTPLDEHFMWLSNEFMPFQTDLGVPYVPPDLTLGLPAIKDWLRQTGGSPWILDPAEHPKLAVQSHHESAVPSSGDERHKRRKKKKKHRWVKKPELKVTTRGQGDDAPVWSHTESNLSSGSYSQTEADSGISSYQKPPNDARSTTQQDHTP